MLGIKSKNSDRSIAAVSREFHNFLRDKLSALQ